MFAALGHLNGQMPLQAALPLLARRPTQIPPAARGVGMTKASGNLESCHEHFGLTTNALGVLEEYELGKAANV